MIYLAKADGTVIGKFSEEELRAKISAGHVSPDDQYLADGTQEWKRVTEFSDAQFPRPASPTPNLVPRKYETDISKSTLQEWLASRTKTFWIVTAILAFVLLFGSVQPGASGGLVGLLRGLIWIAILFGLYFLPTIAARGKRNFQAIFVLNLLLGWTILGWAVAMVWAFTKDPGEK